MSTGRDWFLDACALTAEHAPGPGRWQKCYRCDGSGELRHAGESLNRRAGLMGYDPQMEVSEECPNCVHGWVQISIGKGKV